MVCVPRDARRAASLRALAGKTARAARTCFGAAEVGLVDPEAIGVGGDQAGYRAGRGLLELDEHPGEDGPRLVRGGEGQDPGNGGREGLGRHREGTLLGEDRGGGEVFGRIAAERHRALAGREGCGALFVARVEGHVGRLGQAPRVPQEDRGRD